jgi:hypothetical protein
MSEIGGWGIHHGRPAGGQQPVTYVQVQHPLRRVLNFTGLTIDDVVNDPIVKNKVRGYFKLHKFVQRRCEVVDLERQWNPLGQ